MLLVFPLRIHFVQRSKRYCFLFLSLPPAPACLVLSGHPNDFFPSDFCFFSRRRVMNWPSMLSSIRACQYLAELDYTFWLVSCMNIDLSISCFLYNFIRNLEDEKVDICIGAIPKIPWSLFICLAQLYCCLRDQVPLWPFLTLRFQIQNSLICGMAYSTSFIR